VIKREGVFVRNVGMNTLNHSAPWFDQRAEQAN
jgi:hypothetical protein